MFHSTKPSEPYYARFNNSNHYHYDFGDVDQTLSGDLSSSWTKSGFTGFMKINLYGDVKYLNELLYSLPDTQCTEPIAMAETKASTLACGYNNAWKVLRNGGGKDKYCNIPPNSPVQEFLDCRSTDASCFSSALAEAQALAGALSAAAILFLGFVGSRFTNAYAVEVSGEAVHF